MELNKKKTIKVGIGFATGRINFLKVLRSYIHSWKESGLVDNDKISLNVFVAYDLSYNDTKREDYTNLHPELVEQIDKIYFIGKNEINKDIVHLVNKNVITYSQANMIFGKGYASQRNAVLYNAVKQGMDYLIFFDDDEYPLAVTNTKNHAVWSGQHVLSVHVKNLAKADLTHGHHCGYISPIPYIKYNETLQENDFKMFIESISNDILNWDKIKNVMNNGGITYSDTNVLTTAYASEVEESNGAKFISGANLGINLKDHMRVLPFYNPPGARGEDTFLSTCLRNRKVLRVPCYTFHDGFSTYHHLLEGLLPINLKFISAENNEQIINRFYKASIGWIRYKPLLMYITQREDYAKKIIKIRQNLTEVLPKICQYFKEPKFMNILKELDKYDRNVKKHYDDFVVTQQIWSKMMAHFKTEKLHYLDKIKPEDKKFLRLQPVE